MSTTEQEPLIEPTEPTEPEKDKASTQREYIILEQRAKNGPWTEVKRVVATSAESSIRSLGSDLKQETKYVAIPERNFRPVSPKVETRTTISLQSD